jgi:hypothetical protein
MKSCSNHCLVLCCSDVCERECGRCLFPSGNHGGSKLNIFLTTATEAPLLCIVRVIINLERFGGIPRL